ncbi:MAG: arylesterase [Syntrophobacteraceae bacterium]|jgi:acyl-CoA thioesterase-1|nr:arylesterase [Syntrophobacteraceae bacterium]
MLLLAHQLMSRCQALLAALSMLLTAAALSMSALDGAALAQVSRTSDCEGTIVAFGDSLTQGYVLPGQDAYPAQLERRLRSEGFPFCVVNAGVNGETSSGALSRVSWILRMKPDIVILETGANDGFRGIAPEVIEGNISEIVRILKEKQVIVVLAGMQMLSNLGPDYTTAFRNIYPRVAQRHGVIHIPFFLEGVAGEHALNLPDGIHPTSQGYAIVVSNVWPHVIEAIRSLRKSRGN